jgi:hypothetical protein
MHLLGSLTSLTLLLTTIVPSTVASPVDQSSNDVALRQMEERAGLALTNRQCSNPAQMSLIGDPGINSLTGCGWKMWAACGALAGGVCFLPCLDGGLVPSHPRPTSALIHDMHSFLDPICDGCVTAMGTLGCRSCVEKHELQSALQEFLVDKQDRITQRIQSQYCLVPKAANDIPRVSIQAPAPSTALGSSVPVSSVAPAAVV